MSEFSILYGLSGSECSKQAAEAAWNVASKCGGTVDACHVIDSRAVWELLRNDKPGFIGSGPYIAAYDNLSKDLRSIGDKLAQKYQTVTEEKSLVGKTFILEGNPIELISKKAKEYDLVVVGHQPRAPLSPKDRQHYVRFAVAEGLSHDSPTALLVVQDHVEPWESLTVLVSVDHLNYKFMEACVKFANIMKIKPRVVALASSSYEGGAQAFTDDLKSASPYLKDVDVKLYEVSGIAVEHSATLWHREEISLDWTPEENTLLVIPTRRSGDTRLTVFDTVPDIFVRNLSLSSILMWPEEHTEFGVKSEKAESTMSSSS